MPILPALRRSAAVLGVLLVAATLTGCQPTGHPRCDALKAQVATADAQGYRVRCDASFSGQSNAGHSVLGWTEHSSHTVWMWPDKMLDNRVLRKVAWHEVGHVVWERQGHAGSQLQEERWADGYAYSRGAHRRCQLRHPTLELQ